MPKHIVTMSGLREVTKASRRVSAVSVFMPPKPALKQRIPQLSAAVLPQSLSAVMLSPKVMSSLPSASGFSPSREFSVPGAGAALCVPSAAEDDPASVPVPHENSIVHISRRDIRETVLFMILLLFRYVGKVRCRRVRAGAVLTFNNNIIPRGAFVVNHRA